MALRVLRLALPGFEYRAIAYPDEPRYATLTDATPQVVCFHLRRAKVCNMRGSLWPSCVDAVEIAGAGSAIGAKSESGPLPTAPLWTRHHPFPRSMCAVDRSVQAGWSCARAMPDDVLPVAAEEVVWT